MLGNREVPIQSHIDIYLLSREMPASEKTALEAVMEADQERIKLEKLAEELVTLEDDESQEYLMEVCDKQAYASASFTSDGSSLHLASLASLRLPDQLTYGSLSTRSPLYRG